MLPPHFAIHTLSVETQIGEGGLGDVYSPAVNVKGFLEYNRQLVRGRDGSEIISESTFYTELSEASSFRLDSRVTLPDGTITYVLQSAPRDDGGLTGLSHLEVVLR